MKGRDYMNPYQYINQFNKFGGEGGFKPGLERVESLLSSLGNPEKELDVIHVAGTNGKGSTIELLRSIYSRAGYKVGVYTSPHLLRFNERMTINNREITSQELEKLIKKLDPWIKKMEKDNMGSPTYFEVITVLAIQFFASQEVDLVLLEVGLGGRLDATNVIQKPLTAVITSIDMEHTDILGDDISTIAREKAGIIKKDSPVITAVNKNEACTEIKEIADEKSAEYINIDQRYQYNIISSTLNGQEFTLKYDKAVEGSFEINGKYKVGLLGDYQVKNSVLALGVIDLLYDLYPVTKDNIRKGLLSAKWPGRLEIVNRRPLIILDGAHNSSGMENLSRFLREVIPPGKRIKLITAILEDKDVDEMLGSIKQIGHSLQLIITKNKNKRSMSVSELQKKVEKTGIYYKKYSNLRDAIIGTLSRITSEEVLCISGSLYTVSEAKRILNED